MRCLNWTSLLLVSFLYAPAFAVEAEPEKAEAENKEAEAKPKADEVDRSDREWAQRSSKLNIQSQKIKDATDKLQKLIVSKNAGAVVRDEKNNVVDVLKEMTGTYKQLKTHVEEYNKGKAELKYRYPEEGVLIERRYVPMRLQTLEEIERDIGIEGRLDNLKAKVDKKYEVFVGEKPTVVVPAQPQPDSTIKDLSGKEIEEKNKKRLKLTR